MPDRAWPPTAVVTDSTADLPAEWADAHRVRVVPLHVRIDGADRLDGVELDSEGLVTALRAHREVSTAGPSPQEFQQTYRELLAAGAEEVVSVHVSGELSGTVDAARLAAKWFEQDGVSQVRVIDSRAVAMGLGFPVQEAARLAAAGKPAEQVASAVRTARPRTHTVFAVASLEQLRRGGRIGHLSSLVAGALAVRPILGIRSGRIELLEKVRTMNRARARLVQLGCAVDGPLRLAVHHLGAPELAERLRSEVVDALGERAREVAICELGAGVGAHTGVGALGVVAYRGE